MEAAVGKLIFKRKNISNKVTTLRNYINACEPSVCEADFTVRYNSVEELYAQFNAIQEQIYEQIDTGNAETTRPHEEESSKFDELYYETKSAFARMISTISGASPLLSSTHCVLVALVCAVFVFNLIPYK